MKGSSSPSLSQERRRLGESQREHEMCSGFWRTWRLRPKSYLKGLQLGGLLELPPMLCRAIGGAVSCRCRFLGNETDLRDLERFFTQEAGLGVGSERPLPGGLPDARDIGHHPIG